MKKIVAIIILAVLLFPQALCREKFEEIKVDVEKEIHEKLNIEPIYVALDDCLLIALINNYNLKSAKALYESKSWEYKNALSAFLPQVGLQGFITHYHGSLLVGGALLEELDETALFGAGYISHDLTQGGKTIFQAMSQKNLKKSQNFKFATTNNEILYRVAVNYYRLLETKIVIERFFINLKERAYQYEIAKALYDVGAGEKFDVIRTDIELKQAEIDLLISMNDFKTNALKLANSMGVEVSSPLMPIEKTIKEYKLFNEGEDGEAIYQVAVDIEPSLKALEKEIASLKNDRSKILCDFVPKVDFYAQYSYQGTVRMGVFPNTQIGLNAILPLGENLGLGTLTKVRAMDKQIESKTHALEQARRDIKERILTAEIDSNKFMRKIELNSKQLELSTVSAQIATGKFSEGETILLDVLQAQTEKTRISVELSRARAAYNISQIELLYRSGLISVSTLLRGYSP